MQQFQTNNKNKGADEDADVIDFRHFSRHY